MEKYKDNSKVFGDKMKFIYRNVSSRMLWLKIIIKAGLIQRSEKINSVLKETDELISILFKSIDTAKKKQEAIEISSLGYWVFRNTIRHILVFFARFSQNQLLSFCAAKS